MDQRRLAQPDQAYLRRGRRWRAGVRVRSALAAVLVVGLALAVGAGILVLLLERSLFQSAEVAATAGRGR